MIRRLELLTTRRRTGDKTSLTFNIPSGKFDKVASLLKNNLADQWRVTIETPYKKRTTGENSQNHLFNELIGQIAEHTGMPVEYTKYYVKQEAIPMGWPPLRDEEGHIVTDFHGRQVPASESVVSTVECSAGVDTAMRLLAEFGVTE